MALKLIPPPRLKPLHLKSYVIEQHHAHGAVYEQRYVYMISRQDIASDSQYATYYAGIPLREGQYHLKEHAHLEQGKQEPQRTGTTIRAEHIYFLNHAATFKQIIYRRADNKKDDVRFYQTARLRQ